MSAYTPTTEEVRDYIRAADRVTAHMFAGSADSVEAFDRWLAAHDAEKRAEWEAEHKVTYRVIRDPENPYLAEVHVVDQPAPGERVTHIYKTLTERVPVKQEGAEK